MSKGAAIESEDWKENRSTMNPERINLYDLPRPRLAELLAQWGFAPVHAARLWSYLYREDVQEPGEMHDLPARLRVRLADSAATPSLALASASHSDDGLTRKYLLSLQDGQRIETVLMRYRDRVTACLSSQVGCALGCVFCATGQIGFTRNLTCGEIVAQALHVARMLLSETSDDALAASQTLATDWRPTLRNIVLMGMGEPLLNYDAVMDALDILRDPGGLAIGGKQFTLSTVGVVPGIVRLADERRPFSLAVSLHAATQEERAAMIPAARTWPLDELMEACRYYSDRLGRKVFFEWTLIHGRNDSAEQAQALARLVRGMPAQVNVIPLNATAGFAAEPGGAAAIERFRAILADSGIPSSVRQRRGIDIAAGCGQLAAASASCPV
jgi:23S rRNA (adenine2503-C2)-methyltransferase